MSDRGGSNWENHRERHCVREHMVYINSEAINLGLGCGSLFKEPKQYIRLWDITPHFSGSQSPVSTQTGKVFSWSGLRIPAQILFIIRFRPSNILFQILNLIIYQILKLKKIKYKNSHAYDKILILFSKCFTSPVNYIRNKSLSKCTLLLH
jgi:hypothetical protein